MLQINLPNTNKENVDVDYFKTRNGRFHNVLQCTGIAINFIRGYLIHCYMKKVYIFECLRNFNFQAAEFKLSLCRFLGGLNSTPKVSIFPATIGFHEGCHPSCPVCFCSL